MQNNIARMDITLEAWEGNPKPTKCAPKMTPAMPASTHSCSTHLHPFKLSSAFINLQYLLTVSFLYRRSLFKIPLYHGLDRMSFKHLLVHGSKSSCTWSFFCPAVVTEHLYHLWFSFIPSLTRICICLPITLEHTILSYHTNFKHVCEKRYRSLWKLHSWNRVSCTPKLPLEHDQILL